VAKRISPYSKIARGKELIEHLVLKHKPRCYFCDKVIDLQSLSKGHEPDKLTIHHINEDRSDNRIENLEIAHRGCHRAHHRRLQEVLKGHERLQKDLQTLEAGEVIFD